MKRTIDIILAAASIICCIPLFFIICLVIFLETRKFPIISQPRAIHLDQDPFMLYKFRTLRIPADIDTNNIAGEILLKPELFSYVLKSGYWLRKSGMDELPQIFNILIGQMSFIGPRPLTLSDLHKLKIKYPQLYSLRKKIRAKPGISGLWQIYGKRELGIKNLIEFDYQYEKNKSLVLDLKLLYKTILMLVSATNSDAIIQMRGYGTDKERIRQDIFRDDSFKTKNTKLI